MVAYSLAGGNAAVIIRESGEAVACSLVREGRRRQSLALGPGYRKNSKTVAKQNQLPLAGLDSMCGARTQKTTRVLTIKN